MRRNSNKWLIPAVFGAVLLVAVLAVAIFGDGIGQDDVPDDAVAVVDGDTVSREDFDRAFQQAAIQQGFGEEVPEEGSPQYEAVADAAINTVLDTAWINAEGEERGIEVSDREVQQEFEQTKDQNFKTEKEYQDFLEESGLSQEDIDERVRLQLISTRIQEEVNAEATEVSEDDAKDYYEANEEQFQQPASRDIRIVQTENRAEAQKAFDALSADNSPESWDEVAKQYSTDASSKDTGGVRADVTEGVFPEALSSEIFAAEQGAVVGPVETPDGFFVFQVDTVTEAGAIPFEEARAQIDQQLAQQLQQEAFAAFLSDYRDRWTRLTVCADDVAGARCENYVAEIEVCDPEAQEEAQAQLPEEQRTGASCPAPAFAATGGSGPTPAAPGTIQLFAPAAGQPQRPHPPGGDDAPAAPGALPGGLVPGAGGTVAPGG